jgi:hypothetical protein
MTTSNDKNCNLGSLARANLSDHLALTESVIMKKAGRLFMSGTDDKDLELDPLDLEFGDSADSQSPPVSPTAETDAGLDLDLSLNLEAEESTEINKSQPEKTETAATVVASAPELPPPDELTMSTRVLDLPDLASGGDTQVDTELAPPDDLGFDLSDLETPPAPAQVSESPVSESSMATRVQNLDELKSQLKLDPSRSTSFSDEAMTKLREIDSLLEQDRQTSITSLDELGLELDPSDDDSYVVPPKKDKTSTKITFRDSDDVDLSSLMPDQEAVEAATRITKVPAGLSNEMKADYEAVRGHYGTELERLGATISHLKNDRAELLKKMDEMEKEKSHHQRQMLTLRAELDEKKVEVTIVRKKMGQEIDDLRLKVQIMEEKKALADEKNRLLVQEMEKGQHQNRLDHRKVSARERELEQKLELLKSDAETQIMHRDKMILDLKRKIDGMEFDLDSLNSLEKKSIASKVDLETKLDKAIKTLRSAITILEAEEGSRTPLLDKLKKNLDM